MEKIFEVIDINTEKIWGKKIDDKKIGEVFKFGIIPSKANDIIDINGKRNNLAILYNNLNDRRLYFGNAYKNVENFPFLIKYIYAFDRLSIQVHPKGKNESWLFLKDNSSIIYGLNKDLNINKCDKDTILNSLNQITVNKNDFISVDSGTIHCILENSEICEIKDNCDTTYRIHDWGRNRKLTEEEFMENACFDKINADDKLIKNFSKFSNYKYKIYKYNILRKKKFYNKEKCSVITVLKGNGVINSEQTTMNIKEGKTYFITSNCLYDIKGNIEILFVK